MSFSEIQIQVMFLKQFRKFRLRFITHCRSRRTSSSNEKRRWRQVKNKLDRKCRWQLRSLATIKTFALLHRLWHFNFFILYTQEQFAGLPLTSPGSGAFLKIHVSYNKMSLKNMMKTIFTWTSFLSEVTWHWLLGGIKLNL